jgi:hypothetical protein
LVFLGYRPKTGAALAVVSAVYFVLIKFVVMKHFGAESFVWLYNGLLPKDERSLTGVLKTVVLNPLYTLESLFVMDKLLYVLQIFLPVAFLPLRRTRLWFLLFPGLFITLLTTGYPPVVQTRFQYVVHFIPYVFLAVVAYLGERRESHLASAGPPHVTNGGRAAVPLATFAFATLLATAHFGAFQQDNFIGGFRKIDFGWSDANAARLKNLREIAAKIPVDASVSASELEGAHLGNRMDLFALKDRLDGAVYIFFSYHGLGFGRDREFVRNALTSREYGLFAEQDEFVILRKGSPADDNARILQGI